MANTNGQFSIGKLINNISTKSKSLIATGAGGVTLGAVGSNGFGPGFNGSSSIWLNETSSRVKKYEVFEIDEDLLALSAAWYRLRSEKSNTPVYFEHRLLDDNLQKHVTQSDRDHANKIRDYYSKKIMMLKLKSITLTSYREDLNEFIHNEGKKFKEKMLAIAYRLPEFYDYDIRFDKIKVECNHTLFSTIRGTTTKELKFITKLKVDRRSKKCNEYWYRDSDNNLVLQTLDLHNPITSLLDNVLLQGSISIEGMFYKVKRDDTEFYKIEKYTVVPKLDR